MRLIYLAGFAALVTAGVGVAYGPYHEVSSEGQQQARGAALAPPSPAGPTSAAAGTAKKISSLTETLLHDREACYFRPRDLDHPDNPACDRIGYHERALKQLGARIPRSYPYDPPADIDEEDVVLRYLRLNPEDKRSPDEVNQNLVLLARSLVQDRSGCYAGTEERDRKCEAIGYWERGILSMGADVDGQEGY